MSLRVRVRVRVWPSLFSLLSPFEFEFGLGNSLINCLLLLNIKHLVFTLTSPHIKTHTPCSNPKLSHNPNPDPYLETNLNFNPNPISQAKKEGGEDVHACWLQRWGKSKKSNSRSQCYQPNFNKQSQVKENAVTLFIYNNIDR